MTISLAGILVAISALWTYLSFIPSLFLPIGAKNDCMSSFPVPSLHAQWGCGYLPAFNSFCFFPSSPLLFLLLNLPIWAVDTCSHFFFP